MWPLLSSDLNPSGFYLRVIKVKVMVLEMKSPERHIHDVFNTLRELRGVTLIP